MKWQFDIPIVDTMDERVYRFQVASSASDGGYSVEITLHPDDNAALVGSPQRVQTVERATQAALDAVARSAGHNVRLDRVVDAAEDPFRVVLWVVGVP